MKRAGFRARRCLVQEAHVFIGPTWGGQEAVALGLVV